MQTTTNTSVLLKSIQTKIEHLWSLVGNTPMIAISYKHNKKVKTIYAKCEHYNLTGSIKDRMALYVLQKAYEAESIKPFDTIVEATSGNTGISFSAIGKALGHPVVIIMPDWLSTERVNIIKSFGSEVVLVSKQDGGFRRSIEIANEMCEKDPCVFLPKQFENEFNVEAHSQTTGREIWKQLQSVNRIPDAFVAGVGTGGTIMGVGKYLKSKNPYLMVHPMEPMESPTLSTGHKTGSHRIQGISDEFIPPIVRLDHLNDIISVSDGDAIVMAQKMAKQLGLAVGISSGANIIAAIKAQNYLGADSTVVTVLPDSNKKYLSTDLVKEETLKEHYLSKDVELVDYVPVGRKPEAD